MLFRSHPAGDRPPSDSRACRAGGDSAGEQAPSRRIWPAGPSPASRPGVGTFALQLRLPGWPGASVFAVPARSWAFRASRWKGRGWSRCRPGEHRALRQQDSTTGRGRGLNPRCSSFLGLILRWEGRGEKETTGVTERETMKLWLGHLEGPRGRRHFPISGRAIKCGPDPDIKSLTTCVQIPAPPLTSDKPPAALGAPRASRGARDLWLMGLGCEREGILHIQDFGTVPGR